MSLHRKLRVLATGPPGNSSSRGIFLKKKKKSPHHLPAFSSPWLVGVSLCLVWCTGLPKSDPVLFLKPCCPSSSSPACYILPLWNCPYRLHLGLRTCLDVFPTLKPWSREGLHGLHEAGFPSSSSESGGFFLDTLWYLCVTLFWYWWNHDLSACVLASSIRYSVPQGKTYLLIISPVPGRGGCLAFNDGSVKGQWWIKCPGLRSKENFQKYFKFSVLLEWRCSLPSHLF